MPSSATFRHEPTLPSAVRLGRGPGYAPPMTGSGRFVPGLGVLAGVVVSWAGFHWDIALHGDLGRERFLTTPHLIVVAGMVLQGCAAVWGLAAAADGSGMAAMFRRRPGLALALAAPLVNSVVLWFDNWWHELFGLDVTLWSPPHLLLVLGFVDALLGGIIDLAQQRFPAVGLALISGSLFGILTIVNFEFDIGYPHFATAVGRAGDGLRAAVDPGAERDPQPGPVARAPPAPGHAAPPRGRDRGEHGRPPLAAHAPHGAAGRRGRLRPAAPASARRLPARRPDRRRHVAGGVRGAVPLAPGRRQDVVAARGRRRVPPRRARSRRSAGRRSARTSVAGSGRRPTASRSSGPARSASRPWSS